MKTVVLGLFDREDDARRVLDQLVSSPLDLGAVQVTHADPSVQRSLAQEAGLPPRRAVSAGTVVGMVLGAALATVVWSVSDVLAGPGLALSAAAGLALGALLGGALGAIEDRLRLPPGQDRAVVDAIERGATAVVVTTESVPTARAIRDLFEAAGSRTASPGGDRPPEQASGSGNPATRAGGHESSTAPLSAATPPPPSSAVEREEHSRFFPPWRRRKAPAADPDAAAPSDQPGASPAGPPKPGRADAPGDRTGSADAL